VLVACVAVANAEKFELSIDNGLSELVNDLPNYPDVKYKKNGDDDYTILT